MRQLSLRDEELMVMPGRILAEIANHESGAAFLSALTAVSDVYPA
jgi:hypothetical protein